MIYVALTDIRVIWWILLLLTFRFFNAMFPLQTAKLRFKLSELSSIYSPRTFTRISSRSFFAIIRRLSLSCNYFRRRIFCYLIWEIHKNLATLHKLFTRDINEVRHRTDLEILFLANDLEAETASGKKLSHFAITGRSRDATGRTEQYLTQNIPS